MRKRCRHCQETKPLGEFVVQIRNRDGHLSICKGCHNTARVGRRKSRAASRREDYYDAAFADPTRTKVCRSCSRELHVSQMLRDGHSSDGFRARCFDCSRARTRTEYDSRIRADKALRAKYGIGLDEYERLLAEQHGRCAICDREPVEGERAFAVDHDHDTGRVRGILCGPCNRGIGYLQEEPKLLRAAAAYLEERAVLDA